MFIFYACQEILIWCIKVTSCFNYKTQPNHTYQTEQSISSLVLCMYCTYILQKSGCVWKYWNWEWSHHFMSKSPVAHYCCYLGNLLGVRQRPLPCWQPGMGEMGGWEQFSLEALPDITSVLDLHVFSRPESFDPRLWLWLLGQGCSVKNFYALIKLK